MRLPDPARSHVVLIGTATHQADSGLPDLPAVANNLTDLADALADPLYGWTTPQSQTVIRDPAGAADLGPLLMDIAKRPDDLLLVYYSGHGLIDARGNLHLALAGTRRDRLRYTAFPYDGIREAMLDSPAARRVVILDCCYSGIAIDTMNDPDAGVYDQLAITGGYVLTATTATTTALAPAGARHTTFTGELINLLRVGDNTAPDPLTLDHIYRHLHRTLTRSGRPRPQQRCTDTVAHLALAHNPAHCKEPDDRTTLRREGLLRREDHAYDTGAAGDHAESARLYAGIVPDYIRVFGPDSPETSRVRRLLSYHTGMAGDAATARHLFAELVPHCTRLFGPDDSETLLSRQGLAAWTGEAGDPAKAARMYTELVSDCVRVLGPDNPLTLECRWHLGLYTGEAGNPAEAARMLAELVPEHVHILAPGTDTKTTKVHRLLGYYTGMAGHAAEALRIFAKLVPDCTRAFGPDHRETLLSRQGVAGWTGEAGNPAEATRRYTELVPDCVRVLGSDNPVTLECRRHLALYTERAGNPANALRLYTELLPDCARVLGPDHPETLLCRQALANLA
ncbi:MAG TPA: tetratricopeptide repeat protein [Pseudonocardiaceae bacterium]|nr:tetratricopeptide repeat protein [Pseudonocardiaceae bacterium]